MKSCTKCLILKEADGFYKDNSLKSGLGSWCKECVKICNRDHRAKNAEEMKQKAQAWRDKNPGYTKTYRQKHKERDYFYNVSRRYGITKEQYNQMLANQNNECAGCRIDLATVKKPCVDHCHASGRVRGILCRPCNVVLGMAKDNKETLERLRNYL